LVIKRKKAPLATILFNCYIFFFFQAVDGIRAFHVTGVQTCALPILPAVVSSALESSVGLAAGAELAAKLPRTDRSRDILGDRVRSEEHTSELQSRENLVCRLLLEKKKISQRQMHMIDK